MSFSSCCFFSLAFKNLNRIKPYVIYLLRVLTPVVFCLWTTWRVCGCSWLYLSKFFECIFNFFILWFISKIEKMLICVFHCCNKSCHHKFIDISGTNFPIWPSDPSHLNNFTFSFIWDKVPTPLNWVSTAWRDQSGGQYFVEYSYISSSIYHSFNFNIIYKYL